MPFGDIGFSGYWNASTNRVVGSADDYLRDHRNGDVKLYKVAVAGTTLLSGVNSWSIGDFAYYNGFEWSKLVGSGTILYECVANGFKGDGSSHPLSSMFASLAEAQLVYPRATDLSNEVDGLALQKTIDQQASSGRCLLRIPPCSARLTNELDFTGVTGRIVGAGPLVSVLRDVRAGAKVTLRQGSEAAGQGSPLMAEGLYFINEATPVAGAQGFFIRHNQNAGILQALTFTNVIFHKYAQNTLWDVGRGLDFQNVVIFGPDFAEQPNGGITILGKPGNTWGMFSHRYYNVLIANYRWGWDYQIQNCSVEGHSFMSCSAYNGQGLVNVNCNGLGADGGAGYKSLLWSFDNCDWEGATSGFQMQNCRNVTINSGFYIFSKTFNAMTDFTYLPNNTPAAAGTGRIMFNFLGCSGVSLSNVEMAASDMHDSILLLTDVACDTVTIDATVVRAYNSPAVAGFSLGGTSLNTIVEKNTKWLSWPGGPKIFYLGTGDQFRQISQTDIGAYGGTVTDDGYYQITGYVTLTSDSAGKGSISYPARSNGQSFFKNPPLVQLTAENANTPVGAPSIIARTVNGFSFYAAGGAANLTFAINYTVSGRV